MFTLRRLTSRAGLALTATAFVFNFSVAHAAFSTDIQIGGDTIFDDGFSIGTSGDFSTVSGGIADISTYAVDSSVTGVNPQAGALTDIGDGFGFSGIASMTDDVFSAGFDTYIGITNVSLIDTYEVTFKLNFSNMVNADGGDAYADSELTLFKDGVDEIFFSDLVSDTSFGDTDGGVATGGFGDALSDGGDAFFTYTLNPSELLELDMSWTLEGGDFAGGLAEADLSAFLSVHSVERQAVPTPLPATFFLVGLGLALLPLQRRMRAYMGK